MTVTSVDTDYVELTITLIAEFDAPIGQVWELWSDPRKLERWWGPPGYPVTFEQHELRPGGQAVYVMNGPEGTMRGVWRVIAVDSPTSLEFTDAFAGPDGAPLAEGRLVTRVRLTERDGGTRMKVILRFDSRQDMEKLMSTGFTEGLRQAVAQMDALLASGDD